MPFWKPKKKKKAVHKAKPAKSLPKYEPKPFIPPEIPKIDISANQQKEPQKPAPKKASSSRADDKMFVTSWRLRQWVMLRNRSKKAALSPFTMIAAEVVRL